ncbi:tetratricopeptide repeat protein [Candidatus Parcubacteria bacterium]|nr:MAG: tetratricopeptide repeat protein [Candidatus Parcubacteria bacterium]
MLHWKAGKWPQALTAFQRSLRLNETLGDVEATIHISGNLGMLEMDMGEMQAAFAHISNGLRVAQEIGHNYLLGASHLQMSRYWIAQNDWKKAIQHCTQSQKIFNDIGSQDMLLDVLNTLGEAYLGLGKIEKAQECVRRAFAFTQSGTTKFMGPSIDKGRVLRLAADIDRHLGQEASAIKLLQESIEMFQAVGSQVEAARSMTKLAEIYHQSGNSEKAIALANYALTVFKELGAKPDIQRLTQIHVLDTSHLG